MAGKQAKVLGPRCVERLLRHVGKNRYPTRDRAIVLLSVKAGLRAGEIANLTWSMILNSEGKVGRVIELHDLAAKKGSGRSIPIHPDLKKTLAKLLTKAGPDGPAIRSESGGPMKPNSIINWFGKHYRQVGLAGHRSIDMTQRYIEGDTDAKRRLVAMI